MKIFKLIIVLLFLVSTYTQASLSIDRTRVILDEENKGISVIVENIDDKAPYLLQTWIEDAHGKKITEPLIALPLLQRIEPNQKKQVRINISKNDNFITKNQESLFYFNVLGIPPKSQLENVLEIVIQSRFKLFYRPKGLIKYKNNEWQKELKLEKTGSSLKIINPTPYHIVVININDSMKKTSDFQERVIKPNSNIIYELFNKQKKSHEIVVTYIDDYGIPKLLLYKCQETSCNLLPSKK